MSRRVKNEQCAEERRVERFEMLFDLNAGIRKSVGRPDPQEPGLLWEFRCECGASECQAMSRSISPSSTNCKRPVARSWQTSTASRRLHQLGEKR